MFGKSESWPTVGLALDLSFLVSRVPKLDLFFVDLSCEEEEGVSKLGDRCLVHRRGVWVNDK